MTPPAWGKASGFPPLCEVLMIERWRIWICRNFHTKISRPLRNEYACLECGRRHPVLWSVDPPPAQPERTLAPVCSSPS